MISPAYSPPEAGEAEALLGESHAVADTVLDRVGPTLRHLLGPADPALISDRVLAHTRAMLEHIARQRAEGTPGEPLDAIPGYPALTGHVHALAFETEVAESLAVRLGVDSVTPPLIQAQIALADANAAAEAMQLLAAQARFGQLQRRGELPLAELPIGLLPSPAHDAPGGVVSRLELLGRVAERSGPEALDLSRAGVALFATALSRNSSLAREVAVLSLSPSQWPRLALALLACGLSAEAAERQLLALHPDLVLPHGLDASRVMSR